MKDISEIAPPRYGHGNGMVIGPLNFYKKNETVNISYSGNLPHWNQDNVLQFVTSRLADSLPQAKLREINELKEAWQKLHPKPWTPEELMEYEDIIESVQEWLDAGYGECVLKYKYSQDIIESALRHFDGIRYELYDFIIMPNHIHVLMIPGSGYEVDQIMHSIKSYTSNLINKFLGRTGKLWQRESFDRMIRGVGDYESKRNYIRHNGDFLT